MGFSQTLSPAESRWLCCCALQRFREHARSLKSDSGDQPLDSGFRCAMLAVRADLDAVRYPGYHTEKKHRYKSLWSVSYLPAPCSWLRSTNSVSNGTNKNIFRKLNPILPKCHCPQLSYYTKDSVAKSGPSVLFTYFLL